MYLRTPPLPDCAGNTVSSHSIKLTAGWVQHGKAENISFNMTGFIPQSFNHALPSFSFRVVPQTADCLSGQIDGPFLKCRNSLRGQTRWPKDSRVPILSQVCLKIEKNRNTWFCFQPAPRWASSTTTNDAPKCVSPNIVALQPET